MTYPWAGGPSSRVDSCWHRTAAEQFFPSGFGFQTICLGINYRSCCWSAVMSALITSLVQTSERWLRRLRSVEMFDCLFKCYSLWALYLFDGHQWPCISIMSKFVFVVLFRVKQHLIPLTVLVFIIHPVQQCATWRWVLCYYLLERLFLGAFVSVFCSSFSFKYPFTALNIYSNLILILPSVVTQIQFLCAPYMPSTLSSHLKVYMSVTFI